MAEGAILVELRSQAGGLAFLPRAWLARLTSRDAQTRQITGYPRDLRTLDEYLRKLEARGEVIRVRTEDGGALYGLKATWDLIPDSSRAILRGSRIGVRGSPTTISIVLPGPASLPDKVRALAWTPIADLAHPSSSPRAYRSSPVLGLLDNSSGLKVDAAALIVGPDSKWVGIELSNDRTFPVKIGYTHEDDSGRQVVRGFLRPMRESTSDSSRSVQ